jgi:hypothetical protein
VYGRSLSLNPSLDGKKSKDLSRFRSLANSLGPSLAGYFELPSTEAVSMYTERTKTNLMVHDPWLILVFRFNMPPCLKHQASPPDPT